MLSPSSNRPDGDPPQKFWHSLPPILSEIRFIRRLHSTRRRPSPTTTRRTLPSGTTASSHYSTSKFTSIRKTRAYRSTALMERWARWCAAGERRLVCASVCVCVCATRLRVVDGARGTAVRRAQTRTGATIECAACRTLAGGTCRSQKFRDNLLLFRTCRAATGRTQPGDETTVRLGSGSRG